MNSFECRRARNLRQRAIDQDGYGDLVRVTDTATDEACADLSLVWDFLKDRITELDGEQIAALVLAQCFGESATDSIEVETWDRARQKYVPRPVDEIRAIVRQDIVALIHEQNVDNAEFLADQAFEESLIDALF